MEGRWPNEMAAKTSGRVEEEVGFVGLLFVPLCKLVRSFSTGAGI